MHLRVADVTQAVAVAGILDVLNFYPGYQCVRVPSPEHCHEASPKGRSATKSNARDCEELRGYRLSECYTDTDRLKIDCVWTPRDDNLWLRDLTSSGYKVRALVMMPLRLTESNQHIEFGLADPPTPAAVEGPKTEAHWPHWHGRSRHASSCLSSHHERRCQGECHVSRHLTGTRTGEWCAAHSREPQALQNNNIFLQIEVNSLPETQPASHYSMLANPVQFMNCRVQQNECVSRKSLSNRISGAAAILLRKRGGRGKNLALEKRRVRTAYIEGRGWVGPRTGMRSLLLRVGRATYGSPGAVVRKALNPTVHMYGGEKYIEKHLTFSFSLLISKRNPCCESSAAYGCSASQLDLCSSTLLGGDSDAIRLSSNTQRSPDPFGRE
ncbi:unnamed protein product [Rangifer tarandus platyrhynchus]|uniref:Uncharacterized protein n=1 Tax=Rangifer tarandus platyrhynchus TaxID=3082113 RepID=A0ABN8XK26_RANTA|nr:unnamed protein product [Rangifer tarandus platyrhynchus]